jgi:hypothetical protein
MLKQLPAYAVDRVMVNLFGDTLTFKADGGRSVQGLTCRNIDSSAGSTMDLKVPNGQAVMLQSSTGGDALLFLGFESPPVSQPLHQMQLPPSTPEWVQLPDTGQPMIWQLRITTGAAGLVRVCGPSGLVAS